MTQTEHIKKFITNNGIGLNCNDSMKRFELETGLKVTYANFRRVYITFNEGKNILQVGPTEDPRFKTIRHERPDGLPLLTWENRPNEEKPTSKHVGCQVLICHMALQPCNYYLVSVHKKGDKFWPESDGYTVLEEATGYKRCFIEGSVRLIK